MAHLSNVQLFQSKPQALYLPLPPLAQQPVQPPAAAPGQGRQFPNRGQQPAGGAVAVGPVGLDRFRRYPRRSARLNLALL